jgi:hypothetical protein
MPGIVAKASWLPEVLTVGERDDESAEDEEEIDPMAPETEEIGEDPVLKLSGEPEVDGGMVENHQQRGDTARCLES